MLDAILAWTGLATPTPRGIQTPTGQHPGGDHHDRTGPQAVRSGSEV